MSRVKLVEQIELVRKRLTVNQRKIAGQATDPDRKILAAMYKLLAKDIKADELELMRLSNELAALENPVWRRTDSLLANRLRQLLGWWDEIRNESIWGESQLKTCTVSFRKRLVATRNLLTYDNRHLHSYINEQLGQTERDFKEWYETQQKRVPKYGTEYQKGLKLPESLDKRIHQLQNNLHDLLARTPSSLRELTEWYESIDLAIEETINWTNDKYFSDPRRRLPPDKQEGVKRLFKTIDTKLHTWNNSYRNRNDWQSDEQDVSEKTIHLEPASPVNLLIIEVLWKEVVFKDGYIDIRASFSFSQAYHHVNYSLKFNDSRRSFQAFTPILDTLGLAPLQVQVSVKDRSIVKVINAHILAELIGFLEIKETFDWLEWNTYGGKSQEFDIQKSLRQYPALNRHTCLRHLASLQSAFHRIIFVKEYSSATENGRSSATSDAFLFTVSQGPCLYIIWENEVNSLATYVFSVVPKQYYKALQCIYDYVSSQTIQSKRMRLRENDLSAMNGSVYKFQFVIHDNLPDWRSKISRILR